jgi:hypothetical protein
MKTPYTLTNSDLTFANAYADISPHPEELIQQVITQLMAIEGNGPRSTEIAAAYCVWNCGVEYGKSLPDAEPDDDVQDEFQPRGYIPMPHPGDDMSKPPDNVIELSDTLTLCDHQNPKNGRFGFWLYDKTRGMNLAMRAKTERDAFVEALTYYQNRLGSVEYDYQELKHKVDVFVGQFTEEEEE